MRIVPGQTAVFTGAASGFGLATARLAAARGMNLVLVDVQQEALDAAATELRARGVDVLPWRADVADAEAMDALGAAVRSRFGAPHLVFNNAGVYRGGLLWEHDARDWAWIVGVNLMGVAHGVRVFTPMMLDAAARDPAWAGHVVNTASMAGLVHLPNTGAYNATKSAVVALTETLHQDLALVTAQVRCSVLCPYFVPTAIMASERHRPASLQAAQPPTASQQVALAMGEKAVASAKVTAEAIAAAVLEAVEAGRFYVYSHPHALQSVRARMEDLLAGRDPGDPFRERPEVGERLRRALRKG